MRIELQKLKPENEASPGIPGFPTDSLSRGSSSKPEFYDFQSPIRSVENPNWSELSPKYSNSEALSEVSSFKRLRPDPINMSSNLVNSGKMSLDTPSGNDLTLPVRVKGKTPIEGQVEVGMTPAQMKQMDMRRKEQKKALQRLQDLDALTKNNKSLSKVKTEESDKISLYSGTQSTSNSVSLSNQNNYKEMYDPYKARQEIEQKYNSGAKKNQIIEKYKKDNADYTKSRLKIMQKNLLGP